MNQYSLPLKIDRNNEGEFVKERRLKLDFAAIVEIDQRLQLKSGKDFFFALNEMLNGHINLDNIVDILFWGLTKDDPKLTRKSLINKLNVALQEKQHTTTGLLKLIAESGKLTGVLGDEKEDDEDESEKKDEKVEDENKPPLDS